MSDHTTSYFIGKTRLSQTVRGKKLLSQTVWGKTRLSQTVRGKMCLSRTVRGKMRLSQTVHTRTDNVVALKPYTVEFKAKLFPTVGLNAGRVPYSLLKKMRATVKLDVFATHFGVAPYSLLKGLQMCCIYTGPPW